MNTYQFVERKSEEEKERAAIQSSESKTIYNNMIRDVCLTVSILASFAGILHSHQRVLPLLSSLQANPLPARAAEALAARLRAAAVSVEEVPAADAEPTGAAAHQSRALHSADWTGSDIFKVWAAEIVPAECSAGVVVGPVARGDAGCLSHEWIPNIRQLLHNRLHEQGARENGQKHWPAARVHKLFLTVSDEDGQGWQYIADTETNGLWSAVHHAEEARRMPNCRAEKVSDRSLFCHWIQNTQLFLLSSATGIQCTIMSSWKIVLPWICSTYWRWATSIAVGSKRTRKFASSWASCNGRATRRR